MEIYRPANLFLHLTDCGRYNNCHCLYLCEDHLTAGKPGNRYLRHLNEEKIYIYIYLSNNNNNNII